MDPETFSQDEWRMIHNGLSWLQIFAGESYKREAQKLMDKIRDNFIEGYAGYDDF